MTSARPAYAAATGRAGPRTPRLPGNSRPQTMRPRPLPGRASHGGPPSAAATPPGGFAGRNQPCERLSDAASNTAFSRCFLPEDPDQPPGMHEVEHPGGKFTVVRSDAAAGRLKLADRAACASWTTARPSATNNVICQDRSRRKASRMIAADAFTIAARTVCIASEARQDSLEMMFSSRPGFCCRKNGIAYCQELFRQGASDGVARLSVHERREHRV